MLYPILMVLAYVVYNLQGLSIEEGREWLIRKYKSCWDKLELLPEAKDLALEKYNAIKLVLGESID